MLDPLGIQKVAEDYCARFNEQYGDQYKIAISRAIECPKPAGTYFSLRPSTPVVGGPAGLFVFHDSGKWKEFGTGWNYDSVEFCCRKVFEQDDPEFVVGALLNPSGLEYLEDLARQRGIDLYAKLEA